MILTLNAGSSSLKFSLFDAEAPSADPLAIGQIEGFGLTPHMKVKDAAGKVLIDRTWDTGGPTQPGPALKFVLEWVEHAFPALRVQGIGHRVVHGGPIFSEPVLIDEATLPALERFVDLAPLHQPHNIAGIVAAAAEFPGVPQVACFDTAFHRRHPFIHDIYALPREYYDEGVRRYGFHGLSYEFVYGRLTDIAPIEAMGRVVIAHLGSGCSMTSIKGGKPVSSTLGFSAVDGLCMGTRTGHLDPNILLWLMDVKKMDARAISDLIHKRSGLKGLSGVSNDMRDLESSDDPKAAEAITFFVTRIRHELGGLCADIGGLDALVFTGGIGENAKRIRAQVMEDSEWLGLSIDAEANARSATVISAPGARTKTFVIPTNEEAQIARHTAAVLGLAPRAAAAE